MAATTLPATDMLNDTATLNGTVQPGGLPSTAWFEWRTNFVYEHTTAPIAVGTGWEEISLSNTLASLTPGVIYHYRLAATNRLGVARGADQAFWLLALSLDGPNPMTNECHVPFVDPGATARGLQPAIAAGLLHSLALRADGTVLGWGDNGSGQTTIPEEATKAQLLLSDPLLDEVTISAWHGSVLADDGLGLQAKNEAQVSS